MDHHEIPIQLADRFGLRAFRLSDSQDLVSGLNDWQVARWLANVPHPYRIDHANAFLARPEHRTACAGFGDSGTPLSLALCHEGRVMGGIGLVPSSRRNGARDLGFWMSRPFWGQGIMPSALRAVMRRVSHCAPDTLITASANRDNTRSQRVIKSLGFVECGFDEIYSKPLQRRVCTVCFQQQ